MFEVFLMFTLIEYLSVKHPKNITEPLYVSK